VDAAIDRLDRMGDLHYVFEYLQWSFVLPEGFFRYVALPRVAAYVAIGWQIIGETRCPHDGARAAIVEWPAADQPLEPSEDRALAHAAISGSA
jgi:hypothetical protein